MKRIVSILIENKPGALARVVGLFHQRGYNIESLNVAPVFDGSYSRMTVATHVSENDVEQITKQINKIIDVIKVADLSAGANHEHEFMLIKFNKLNLATKIQKILKSLNCAILEKSKSVMVMSAYGPSGDIEIAIKTIGKSNLLECVRSGSLGLHEGEKKLTIGDK